MSQIKKATPKNRTKQKKATTKNYLTKNLLINRSQHQNISNSIYIFLDGARTHCLIYLL